MSIDALIVVGGNGTLSATSGLYSKGLPVVGVPKTIDRDVYGTDYTIDFSSAVQLNRFLINDVRHTASSHNVTHVVQVMGRDVGHLALHSGKRLAGIILIPEYAYSLDQVVSRLEERREKTAYDIIVCAEKAYPRDEEDCRRIKEFLSNEETKPYFSIGQYLSERLKRLTGFEIKSTKFDYVQRGAPTNEFDKERGEMFGVAAVQLVFQEKFGEMVSIENGEVTHNPLSVVPTKINNVKIDKEYDTEKLQAQRLGLGTITY